MPEFAKQLGEEMETLTQQEEEAEWVSDLYFAFLAAEVPTELAANLVYCKYEFHHSLELMRYQENGEKIWDKITDALEGGNAEDIGQAVLDITKKGDEGE